MVSSSPDRTNPYTSKIQSCWVADGARSRLMNGTAKYSTETSIDTSSRGSASTANPIRSRRPAR